MIARRARSHRISGVVNPTFHRRVRIFSGSTLVMSVVMNPGATTLTVIPREASSRAIVLLNPIIPALLAE